MDRNDQGTGSKAAERAISIEELKQKFVFDLPKGEIYRLKDGVRGDRADKLQFFKGNTYERAPRYRQIQVTYRGKPAKISAHRAIWAVKNGRWPLAGHAIDHLNGDTQDNRIANLEEVTIEENRRRVHSR